MLFFLLLLSLIVGNWGADSNIHKGLG
jgi:hypothetical protein